jgi:hypothetical protein
MCPQSINGNKVPTSAMARSQAHRPGGEERGIEMMPFNRIWTCRAMRAAIIQREPAKLVRDALLSFHAAKLVLSVTGMSWIAMIGFGLTTILLVRKNLGRA